MLATGKYGVRLSTLHRNALLVHSILGRMACVQKRTGNIFDIIIHLRHKWNMCSIYFGWIWNMFSCARKHKHTHRETPGNSMTWPQPVALKFHLFISTNIIVFSCNIALLHSDTIMDMVLNNLDRKPPFNVFTVRHFKHNLVFALDAEHEIKVLNESIWILNSVEYSTRCYWKRYSFAE